MLDAITHVLMTDGMDDVLDCLIIEQISKGLRVFSSLQSELEQSSGTEQSSDVELEKLKGAITTQYNMYLLALYFLKKNRFSAEQSQGIETILNGIEITVQEALSTGRACMRLIVKKVLKQTDTLHFFDQAEIDKFLARYE